MKEEKEIKPQPFILNKISKIKDRKMKFKVCRIEKIKKKPELSG